MSKVVWVLKLTFGGFKVMAILDARYDARHCQLCSVEFEGGLMTWESKLCDF